MFIQVCLNTPHVYTGEHLLRSLRVTVPNFYFLVINTKVKGSNFYRKIILLQGVNPKINIKKKPISRVQVLGIPLAHCRQIIFHI